MTRSSSKTSDEERVRRRSVGGTKSPVRMDGTPVELPGFMKTNYFLNHEALGLGQKQYIWGVARIYSVTQLMSLKQRQYQNLLDYEFSRRIQNKELKEHERVKEWKDYQRYCKFIKRYEQVLGISSNMTKKMLGVTIHEVIFNSRFSYQRF